MPEFDNPLDPMLRLKCEWLFPSDPQGDREGFYAPEAIAHPAKMDVNLAQALVYLYSNPGEWVLDPMSGIGTTPIECLKLGRNALVVELEKPFFELQKSNVNLTFGAFLSMLDFQDRRVAIWNGNSKNLRALLAEPPHFSRDYGRNGDGLERSDLDSGEVGRADVVITSPPFAEQNHPMGKTSEDVAARYPNGTEYSDNPENIGNMRYGTVDAVITSPPFVNENRGGGAYKAAKGVDEADEGGTYGGLGLGRVAQILSEDPENLDNIKAYDKAAKGKPTFLGELGSILAETVSVLKPGGLLVLHSKDSVKGGERVTMGADLIKICEALGMEHEPCPECGPGVAHTHRRRIPNPSFWINMRTARWIGEHVPGYEINRVMTGKRDPKSGKLETRNELWHGDHRVEADEVRKLAVEHNCPYAGYWEDVIVLRKKEN